jgi:hypothetical protein
LTCGAVTGVREGSLVAAGLVTLGLVTLGLATDGLATAGLSWLADSGLPFPHPVDKRATAVMSVVALLRSIGPSLSRSGCDASLPLGQSCFIHSR